MAVDACRSEYLLQTLPDCTQAARLIEDISAAHLLADKGYDSDKIVKQAEDQGMTAVISPRSNIQREYHKESLKIATSY